MVTMMRGLSYGEIFRVGWTYVCLLSVNINQQANKQDQEKSFLSKQKPVDRDGFCEGWDAFCDVAGRNWVWMGGIYDDVGRFLGAS
ncbi:hypothetical protein [Paraburkholderia oxyphila]|uniref:hypothetical protein n=1 Tax=Paraburkholderia oxyphila TaxID=614212 RepID=UPI0012EE85B5|nr:hypothetical protein [Paraburkholderia oxyphila]